ncbi:DUF1800 domain-containing protein [Jannaschia sp. S6380]|uniref:DUF1800 domain-containing protein n=1 Tax=Jannaschia sp. S6380 TaxID=2926408 RepID=UPI001FF6BD48|nr:DUF1800 domain-containing protein [Jannaschia sp. S6380]MCK0167502.1 DUF1800 domain-containing protein [Jannaschia sp. S6380]
MIPTLAAIRFGTGLAPDIAPPAGADDLLQALSGPDQMALIVPLPGWAPRMADLQEIARLRRALRDDRSLMDEFDTARQGMNRAYYRDLAATLQRAAITRDGFRERLVWFWTGHFAITEGAGFLRRTVGGYVEEAIRPHVGGTFASMLRSAVKHPAMLNFLDQVRSAGPGSPRGRRGGGMNENLAREVLELHTLGAGAKYTQTDVRQLAELMTGLTQDRVGAFKFQPNMAEPGAETVLGRSYGGDDPSPRDVDAVLDDLAAHPATARHVSRKLARHFVSDAPPPEMVRAMTEVWARSDGDLIAVYAAMLDHPAAWAADLSKVRQPLDFVAAAIRATGTATLLGAAAPADIRRRVADPMARMGQPFLRPPSPDGWREDARAWVTPQGLASRLDWAMDAARLPDPIPDPRAFVDTALGPLAGSRTRFAAQAAEDRAAGVGLVLAAPEFQRR